MANPVLGKSLCSDWFFLSQDFAVRTVSMETVQSVYFCFGAKPANSNLQPKQRRRKKCEYCHSSHWNYQKKPKRLKFFQNFKAGYKRRRTVLSASHRKCILLSETECQYNKQLTNRACLGHTGEFWPSVVAVRLLFAWSVLPRPLANISWRSVSNWLLFLGFQLANFELSLHLGGCEADLEGLLSFVKGKKQIELTSEGSSYTACLCRQSHRFREGPEAAFNFARRYFSFCKNMP